jgi:hypothetical protein
LADTASLTTTLKSACIAAKAQFEDNIFSKSPLLKQLWAKRWTTDGGSKVEIPVRWSKGTTTTRRDLYAEFTFAETDTVKTPELDWVSYQCTAKIPFEKNYMASGKHRVLNLLQIELSRMENEMHEYIATDMFSDASTASPVGITGMTAICDTDNVYAGFDRASLASTHPWMGHVTSQASLVHTELASYIDTCSVRGFKIDQIWTTPAVKTLMRFAWGVNVQRFVGGGEMGIAPAEFTFQGIPVYSDDMIPAGYVLVLCTRTFKFAVPVGSDPFEIETFSDESQYKGVKLRVAPMLQFMCTAPYHNYLITDVAACATS